MIAPSSLIFLWVLWPLLSHKLMALPENTDVSVNPTAEAEELHGRLVAIGEECYYHSDIQCAYNHYWVTL